jgi:hypothetical protein
MSKTIIATFTHDKSPCARSFGINLFIKAKHKAELHEEGSGEEDGPKLIRYDTVGVGFGFGDKGKHEMRIKVKNVRSVIEESGADVAKFDCEGAEKSLIDVPSEVLRKIDFYIIEVHTSEIKKANKKQIQRFRF